MDLADVLGIPGAGEASPDEVLDRMPGAALVHVACHAVTAESVDESRLELTAPLSVRRVLDRSTRRGATEPGPRVVLSSCSSDLTGRDHDEALTLATAFLAAGAVTVVGSRWPVLDRSAGIVTYASLRPVTDNGRLGPAVLLVSGSSTPAGA